MSPALTRDDVLRIAALARLELTDAEVEMFTAQLGGILRYAAQVQAVDTTDIAPMSHAQASGLAWREDEPAPSLTRDAVFGNAPDASPDAGLFKVPKVL